MHGACSGHCNSLLDFSYHQDPSQHLSHLFSADRLNRVPDWAIGRHNRLRRQVKGVIPAFHTLRAFKEVEIIQLDGTSQWVLWIFRLFCIHIICNFLAGLMYPQGLQVPNTRALILRIRGVFLGLTQNLGEGQLHMLVHCLQQEVLGIKEHEGGQQSGRGVSPELLALPQHLLSHMAGQDVA